MRARQFIVEGAGENANVVEMFKKFLPLAMEVLEIDSLPKMHFAPELNTGDQPSFGMYAPDDNLLAVALSNRHPVDILRTVAHELQHYKQDTEHQLDDESGTTGSAEENEANAMAGIVMRHFNKQYPEYLSDRPVIAESKRLNNERSAVRTRV
jgi:Zn-dependent peptidase ImmA (M78 family)